MDFWKKFMNHAMMIELNRLGLNCERQKQLNVIYDDLIIGEYFADILVNNLVIVELKAAESFVLRT